MPNILENPIVKLAPIVIRLYELSGNTDIADKSMRAELYGHARELRGDMVNLASKQFREETAAYTAAMQQLVAVNAALASAQTDITKVVDTIEDITALTKAIDNLLKVVAVALA